MDFWKMKQILTCRHCGGELEKHGNQTGRWYECKKCKRIIQPGDVDIKSEGKNG